MWDKQSKSYEIESEKKKSNKSLQLKLNIKITFFLRLIQCVIKIELGKYLCVYV